MLRWLIYKLQIVLYHSQTLDMTCKKKWWIDFYNFRASVPTQLRIEKYDVGITIGSKVDDSVATQGWYARPGDHINNSSLERTERRALCNPVTSLLYPAQFKIFQSDFASSAVYTLVLAQHRYRMHLALNGYHLS